MASISGDPQSFQSQFYTEQERKYQEVEPNRLQPEKVEGSLGSDIVNSLGSLLAEYDPYLDTTQGPSLTPAALTTIVQGESSVTTAEKKCRSYEGYSGLLRLIQDQAAKALQYQAKT